MVNPGILRFHLLTQVAAVVCVVNYFIGCFDCSNMIVNESHWTNGNG